MWKRVCMYPPNTFLRMKETVKGQDWQHTLLLLTLGRLNIPHWVCSFSSSWSCLNSQVLFEPPFPA